MYKRQHFYLTLYWAQELAKQTKDSEMAEIFKPVAEQLEEKEAEISKELLDIQGSPVDLGGYYWVDEDKTNQVMRPSKAFNEIIDGLNKNK